MLLRHNLALAVSSSFFFFFFFHLTYSRWTSSLPSCLWSQRIFPSLPGSRLTIFLSRCKFSTLTSRQPMIEFYLLTFPRFPLRKKEHISYFGKNRTHDFRTSSMCSLPTRPLGRRAEPIICQQRHGYTDTRHRHKTQDTDAQDTDTRHTQERWIISPVPRLNLLVADHVQDKKGWCDRHPSPRARLVG